jgi:DNA-binding response OmpR family regulator
VDILLLDYRLGDATGDDVASKIRDLDGTKTILISGYELERERVNELNACHRIVDLVHKPVSIKILMERVQQALT